MKKSKDKDKDKVMDSKEAVQYAAGEGKRRGIKTSGAYC